MKMQIKTFELTVIYSIGNPDKVLQTELNRRFQDGGWLLYNYYIALTGQGTTITYFVIIYR